MIKVLELFRMKGIIIVFIGLLLTAFSCNTNLQNDKVVIDSTEAQGDLIIFYSSSMTIPMKKIIADFEQEYPHVKVLADASGSRTATLKISEMNRACDILISSDYQVINNLLIPIYTNWYIEFASNEIVLAYNDSCLGSNEINTENWFNIIQKDSIRFGRTDPDSDPCGIRSVLAIKLAEKHYQVDGLKDQLLFKDKKWIRPNDLDLLKLLDNKELDYIFIYKSVAEQRELSYVLLPEQINLGSPKDSTFYGSVSMKVSSNKPGSYILRRGEPIKYAFTVLNTAPNPIAAEAFAQFLISKKKGLNILKNSHMQVLDSLVFQPNDSIMKANGIELILN